MLQLIVLAMAQAAGLTPVSVTPVTLDRLADDFDQICVKTGGDDAAMKAAADAYQQRYPGVDRPSYSAMRTKTGVTCIVFGAVVQDASSEQLRNVASSRFAATLRPAKGSKRLGQISLRVRSIPYDAQVTDQNGRRVAFFSVSYPKDTR